MENLHISLLQLDLLWQDPAANRAHAEAWLRSITTPTDLIVLPEMFSTGFSMDAAKVAEPDGGKETLKWMQDIASQKKCVVAGSIAVADAGKYYNRFYAVNARGVIGQYDKRHLFRMTGEQEVFEQGKNQLIFTLKGWRIRPQICYDLRFPVWSRNQLPDGALATDLLLYVANWPQPRISHWKTLLQARAIENQCCVAGVNRVGSDGNNFAYTGDSMIVDHQGAVQATEQGREAIVSHSLDAASLTAYRERFPAWQDADPFVI